MSKEIKEKCKSCICYTDEPCIDYTVSTTHSNCMSSKCKYRKLTKDLKIKRLTSEVESLRKNLIDSEERRKKLWKFLSQELQTNDQLKQQLAEKEKEIEILHKDNTLLRSVWDTDEQDKISFTVEKLEEVKKNIKNCPYKDFGIMYQSDAIRQIDNQIKMLKEGK